MLKLITIATLLFPYPLATFAGQDEVRTTEKTYRLRMTEGLPSRMYPCYPYRYCQTFEVPETVVDCLTWHRYRPRGHATRATTARSPATTNRGGTFAEGNPLK